jgi:precorrin-2/cobalt-factor-2 C20-methyltransferase
MILHCVGVGPGDRELLTLKARRLVVAADIIFAPTGRANEGSLALSIVEEHIDRMRQQVVLLPFPLTRDARALDAVWRQHANLVAERLAGGRAGVFLVEGDPSLYGSFNHLRRALRRWHPDIQVEVVPGVPSIMAAAAVAGMPLAGRDERIAVLPSARDAGDLAAVLLAFDTVVLMKVSTDIDAIVDALETSGRIQDAVWIRRAGCADQAIERDVRRLRGTRPDYFSLMIVRKHEQQT